MKRTLLTSYSSNFLWIIILSFLVCSCNKSDDTKVIDLKKLDSAYHYQQKADSLYHLNQLDSAFNNYLKSNQLFKHLAKTESITYNNLRISTIYLIAGDPNSAQEILVNEISQTNNISPTFKNYIYSILATCYSELIDYDLSNKYAYKSLRISNISVEAKAIINNNIASNYISLKEYTKAIDILQDILSSNVFKEMPLEQARCLNNLGKALYLQDKSQGLKELEEALAIRLNDINQNDIYRSYINLAEYYTLNKDYHSAHDYALKAYEITTTNKNKKDKLQALEYLIKSSTDSPSKYYADYIDLSKEIATETQQAKNQFAKIRYDFEQHEQENIKLKLDLQHSELVSARSKNALYVSLLCLLAGGVITSFIYRRIKHRHRLDKIQQSYLTETKIAKKIHDELANDVFNALTYTQNFNLQTPETKNHLLSDLESIYKKARNISLQHSSIATDKTFVTHLTNLFNEYTTANCQIIISGLDNFDFSLLDKNQKITIYRVIQELLVNMKKHSMATIVVFKFSEDKKHFKIFYSDNGVGIIQEDIKSKNGLSNVENRITNIGGTFIFDSTNKLGVKYNIQLPKKNYV
ncbi:tetratricopeptide repeat-containing sensor histidine kinase [Myroides odoratimimus]|uniref:tetratricopeptide repeat-containing sensor histidine kinase n=1 Tax=Myroides odoratimimus TaxID=76832 RepID=UPI002576754E|nr:tetratricopeptide repeat-containing sensor histidine kinase [Myroides odoratimimus]MDM1514398.1 histidine kinase [Myroides odoratimimus]